MVAVVCVPSHLHLFYFYLILHPNTFQSFFSQFVVYPIEHSSATLILRLGCLLYSSFFQISLTYPFTTILLLCTPWRIFFKKKFNQCFLIPQKLNCKQSTILLPWRLTSFVWHAGLNKDECLYPISLFLSIHKWLLTPTPCVNGQLYKIHT